MKKLTYQEKFEQMNKEAIATCLITIILIIFWSLGAFFIDDNLNLYYIPVWFLVSCLGTYLLAIFLVCFIVKVFFKDFDLDDKENKDKLKEIRK